MATTSQIPRKFAITLGDQKVLLPDLNPALSADDIMELYSNQYPQLLNATLTQKGLVDEHLEYEFQTIAGNKG